MKIIMSLLALTVGFSAFAEQPKNAPGITQEDIRNGNLPMGLKRSDLPGTLSQSGTARPGTATRQDGTIVKGTRQVNPMAPINRSEAYLNTLREQQRAGLAERAARLTAIRAAGRPMTPDEEKDYEIQAVYGH